MRHWNPVDKLTASDGFHEDRLSASVAISNDDIIGGAHGNDDQGNFSGAAYIFEYIFGPPIPGNSAIPSVPSLLFE